MPDPHYAQDGRFEPFAWFHPVDELEPLPTDPNGYRDAAKRLVGILEAVFRFMDASPEKHLASLQWAFALGLPSVRPYEVAELARQWGVSERHFRAGVNRFLELANVPPACGLGPVEADPPPRPSLPARRAA